MSSGPRLFVLAAAVALLNGGCTLLHGPLDDESDDAVAMLPHPHRTEMPTVVGTGTDRVREGRFPVIRYGSEGWEVPAGEAAKVSEVARWFVGHPERVLITAGATVAPAEYARQLSDRRSQAVRKALISAGVPASKILAVAFGNAAPERIGNGVGFSVIATGE